MSDVSGEKLWPATMTTHYSGKVAKGEAECQVRLSDGSISITYMGDEKEQVYSGKSVGEGHYELTGEGFDASATLHNLPGSRIFEGSWVEDGYVGMWSVKVHDYAPE